MTKFHVREMHVQGKHVSGIYLGYIGDSPVVTQLSASLLQKIYSLQKIDNKWLNNLVLKKIADYIFLAQSPAIKVIYLAGEANICLKFIK